MAYTVINTTDTLEQMRVKLNNLTTNDFGDPALLVPAGISATSVVGAVVELAAVAFSAGGYVIKDSANTTQTISSGQTLTVLGTTNQINAVVSPTRTLTLSFPTNVTLPGNLTTTGTLHTLGTIEISGNNIRSTDSTTVRINDSLNVNGSVSSTSVTSTGAISGTTITGSSTIQGTDLVLTGSAGIQFEGSTADNFETTLVVVDPTADRTITIPNITGTIVTTGDTGTVTSAMIADATIVNGDIADNTIRGAKLNVSTDSVTFGTVTATNFTGIASIATAVTLGANNSNNETVYLVFSDTATGNQSLETDTSLSYNPSTNILSTTATQARYADLAEIYETDKLYDVGTVVMVGGEKEVTECFVGKRALGVISDRPAFLMNSQAKGQPIALKGRVKVKVVGAVKKGDELVAGNGGFATTISEEFTKVFAIALEDNEKGLIEAIIL
jgi:cytoskeletal protein CcmA (bactofilin family)